MRRTPPKNEIAGLQDSAPATNGNMTSGTIGGQSYSLTYDAENRLISLTGGSLSAIFTYDGDGNRVKSVIGNTTTYFLGNYYEASGATERKYYYAGTQRVAMRVDNTVYYLLSDQLGSTTVTTNSGGDLVGELRYDAWGVVRYSSYSSGTTQPKYQYTGQYADSYINLLDYGSRRYDPELGRFIQPDTIVPDPGNPQDWDRYGYARNNPVRYNDPSGHCIEEGDAPPGSIANRNLCGKRNPTPGELMQLHKNDQDKTQLSQEVEDYLEAHPDYNPGNDPYLGFSMGDNRDLAFKDLRVNYWQERLRTAGVCESQYFCVDAAEKLFTYYDLHQDVRGPAAWDSSKVNWPSVALDAAGIPLSLVGLGPLKPTTQAGARILFWTGIVDSGVSAGTANNPGKTLLAVAGGIPIPGVGTMFNIQLTIWDLEEGTYYLPYTPPVGR